MMAQRVIHVSGHGSVKRLFSNELHLGQAWVDEKNICIMTEGGEGGSQAWIECHVW